MIPPRPGALLFDLDGTLVDSRADIAAALNAALATVGVEPLELADVLPMVGDGARVLVERALRARGRALDESVIAAFHQSYLEHPAVHTTLMPGVSEVVAAARAMSLPCAMVTNKPRAVAILVLEALGLLSEMRETWAGGDGPLKPAPDGILAIAAKLEVPVQNAWMIGDGPQDVAAGKAAGAFTIAVPGIADEAPLRAAEPHVLLKSLADLPALLTSAASARSL